MSRRWKLQSAVEDLENQIALLHDRVAALDKAKATLALAQVNFDRAKQLLGTPAESRQQYDQRQEEFSLPAHKLSSHWLPSTKFARRWDCHRNPSRAAI